MVVNSESFPATGQQTTGLVFRGDKNPSLLQVLVDFRVRVWSGIESESLARKRFGRDESDDSAWHVVYRTDHAIVACGRLTVSHCREQIPDQCSFGPYLEVLELPAGVMNRLVVDPAYQGRGLGTRINNDRIAIAAERGVSTVLVEVQQHRVRTMKRLGFSELGPSGDTSVKGDWRIMRHLI